MVKAIKIVQLFKAADCPPINKIQGFHPTEGIKSQYVDLLFLTLLLSSSKEFESFIKFVQLALLQLALLQPDHSLK